MSLSERFTEVEGYGSFGPRSTSPSIAASVIPKVLANLSAQAREGVLFTSFREVLSDCPGRAGSSPYLAPTRYPSSSLLLPAAEEEQWHHWLHYVEKASGRDPRRRRHRSVDVRAVGRRVRGGV
jgi:hypothetical protein